MKSKIAYLCSSESWGGLEMNQVRNATWMMKRGYPVVFFCRENTPLHQEVLASGIPFLSIPKHKKYFDFKKGKELAEKLDSNHITHLIIRDTKDMSIAVIAKRNVKNTLHLSYFMEMQLGVPKKNIFHTLRFSYFDLWSCPLDWLKDQVLSMTYMKGSKVVVIPSGLDFSSVQTELTTEEARKQLDLPLNVPIVGLIGRIDPKKGQLLLLHAAKLIQHPVVHICLLGETTKGEGTAYLTEIEEYIETSQFNNRVHIRPFRKDISTFYKAIDRFVMATNGETFGMVTLEAMAAGCRVVGSASGGTIELLEYGQLGLLFEPGNPVSLAEKIEKSFTFTDQNEIERLLTAVTKYDHNIVVTQIEKNLNLTK